MLTAIPGFNHLKIWRPAAANAPAITQASTQQPPPYDGRAVHRLLTNALDVAAGRKPLASLSTSHYSPAVLRHLNVRRKVHPQRGNASIQSLHIHDTSATTLNVSGACNLIGRPYAYSARIQINAPGERAGGAGAGLGDGWTSIRLEALRIL